MRLIDPTLNIGHPISKNRCIGVLIVESAKCTHHREKPSKKIQFFGQQKEDLTPVNDVPKQCSQQNVLLF